jgi:parallel beta-helix repeat protein
VPVVLRRALPGKPLTRSTVGGVSARLAAYTVASCFAASALAGRASAAAYYVNAGSASCTDAGAGTLAQPYCSISAALAAHHTAGTQIFVLPGIYREQVTVPTSGTADGPIVLQAMPQDGQPVLIDGSDDFSDPSLWNPYSGNVWFAPSVTWSPVQVFADSARLKLSPTSPDELPQGSFTYVDGSGLYVNLGGDNPGGHRVAVGRRPYGFYVSNRAYVSISGFTVTRSENRGIQLTNGSSNAEINHNEVMYSGRFGVQLEKSSAVHLASNVIHDNTDHGISVTAGSTGCTIEGNESFHNGLPIRRTGDGIYLYGATGNVIQRNRFHHNQMSGEDFQNGANDNVSVQNLSWLNGYTGFNHVKATGNVHNGEVAFYNNWDGFAMDVGSTGQTLFNCIGAVNGIVHSRYNLEVDSSSTAGLTSNDNIFWHPSGETPVRYSGKTFQWVKDYTAASGQDSRTIQNDPLFVDPFAGDFHLLAGSPAIDAANSSTPNWPSTDFGGQPRVDDFSTFDLGLGPVTYADRGAFEFVSSGATSVPADTVPRLDHVLMVIMENKAYNTVRFAPYTADLIAHSASFAHAYAYAHQSQSDYYALWSAVGRPVTESICPAVGSPYFTENLGHLCETNGRTWRAYSEDLPAPGDTVCYYQDYARRHCPWTDWGNLDHMNERPFEDLAIDIANGTLPNLAMVVPNLCNDTHNDCGQDTVLIGDNWLSQNLPTMIDAVGPRGLVIVLWDEDDGSDGNHILTVFSSPLARTGYVSNRFINFFVVVRTMCDALGLPAFGEAATSKPITDVWVRPTAAVSPPGPTRPVVALGPVVPNPFRGSMSATLTLPAAQPVEAAIFDLSGRRVRHVLSGTEAGRVQIRWDGTDDSGRAAHPGLYMLAVRAGSTTLQRKVLLVR